MLRDVRRTLLDGRVAAGHWEGHLSSSALATATAVTALAVAHRGGASAPQAGRLVDEGLRWLIATKNPDGGWGDTPDSVSNISTTALVWAALGYSERPEAHSAASSAQAWIENAAGSAAPERLAAALAARYGNDRTFSVPILTMCAIAGRLGAGTEAWRLIPQLPFELSLFPRRFFGALRLPVVSYALPALISMGLARHRRGPGLNGLRYVRSRAAIPALAALERLQPVNGGFLEAVPLTSFVTMSLVAAGESRHVVVTRALDFLTRAVRSDGSWPIDSNLATWATTLSVNALGSGRGLELMTDGEQRRVRDWLLGQQWRTEHPYTGAAPGGWAWTDLPGGVPDADDTAGALVALSYLGSHDSDVRAAATAGIRWLLDLQNRDGGIPTFCRGWGTQPFDRSSTDLTAHALRAFAAWLPTVTPQLRARVDIAIERAVRFLGTAQRHDGAFVPLWFGNQHEAHEENPVFGTSRVLAGLVAVAGNAAPRASVVRQRAVHWLVGAQNEDGGWGAGPAVASSIEETAVAVGSIAACGGPGAAVSRGLAWLSAATDHGRRFSAAPIGLYFARLWYSEQLYPVIFTTAALEQANMFAAGRASNRALTSA